MFTTSIVIRAPDASPEKTTSQDGADVEVLVHTLVEDDDEEDAAPVADELNVHKS